MPQGRISIPRMASNDIELEAAPLTDKLNLPLYTADDRCDLTAQYNAAMGILDTQVSANQSGLLTAEQKLATLETTVTDQQSIITAQGEMITDHSSELQTVDYRLEALEDGQTGGGGIGGEWKSYTLEPQFLHSYTNDTYVTVGDSVIDVWFNEEAKLFRISGRIWNSSGSRVTVHMVRMTQHENFANWFAIPTNINLSTYISPLFKQGAEYRQPLSYPNVMSYSALGSDSLGHSYDSLLIDSSGVLHVCGSYETTHGVSTSYFAAAITSTTYIVFNTGIRSFGASNRVTLNSSGRDLGC